MSEDKYKYIYLSVLTAACVMSFDTQIALIRLIFTIAPSLTSLFAAIIAVIYLIENDNKRVST